MLFHKKLFITPTLAMVIGTFVVITATVILIIQALTSEQVIRRLGGSLVELGMESSEVAFNEQLHAVAETAKYTEASWTQKEITLQDPKQIMAYLFGALAPMDRVSFLVLVDENGVGVDVDRGNASGNLIGGNVSLAADIPSLVPLTQKAAAQTAPFWSQPTYMPSRQHTYFVYVQPLYENGDYRGSFLLGMSLERISNITWSISNNDIVVFLMKQGSHDIIAHPLLHEDFDQLNHASPLLHVSQISDAFLKSFQNMPKVENAAFDIAGNLDLHAGYDINDIKRFVIIEQQNNSLMGMPARIGVHFPAEYLDQPLDQLTVAIAVGAGLLLISLLGAVLLARRIARPVQRASIAAQEVARLNLDAVSPLPSSNIKELDDLSKGFNAMVGGLTAFNRYVPRSLVYKLLREGRADTPPEARDVAVLFTDIVGFTTVSEGMSATQTADFVNHHLSLLGGEIARHNGTIDKYIGDSVMAFWGAPENLDNPAEQAARAALGMADAIHTDNLKRIERQEPPVRIRIGLHLGPLVVGDIGAPGRVNYTVIGDTVNAASRLESLGKEIDPEAEIIILASDEVARNLSPDILTERIGSQVVEGRAEPLQVVRLLQRQVK